MKTLILVLFILVTATGVVFGAFQSDDPLPGTFFVEVQEFYAAGQLVSVTFETEDTLNVYALQADVLFDPRWLTFQGGTILDPHTQGFLLADLRGPNHVGVGFTRSDRTDSSWTGSVFTLSFLTSEVSDSTLTRLRFWNLKAYDNMGNAIVLNAMSDVTFTIVSAGEGADVGDGEGDNDSGSSDTYDGYDPDDDPDPVVNRLFSQVSILQFVFRFENATPTRASYSNRHQLFKLEGGTFTYVDGANGTKLTRSDGWGGALDKSKYWHTRFNSMHMDTVRLRWQQYGSASGPRDFQVESRLPGGEWTLIPGFEYSIGTSSVVANSLFIMEMPVELAQQEQVEVRWVMASNARIDGSETPIHSGGTNHMGQVIVLGVPEDKSFVTARLGDTNNDGKTDHTDILPIGMYWESSGVLLAEPVPAGWHRVSRQRWFPMEATYADTDGDGHIDQGDLARIGRFYGYTTLLERAAPAGLTLMQGDGVSSRQVFRVSLQRPTMITGISGSIHVPGLDPDQYQLSVTSPLYETLYGEAGSSEVFDGVRMLEWSRKLDDGYAFAWVDRSIYAVSRKSFMEHVLDVVVERTDGQPIDRPIELSGVSVVEQGVHLRGQVPVKVESLFARGPDQETELPDSVELLPAYPNPFNPSTTVRWTLPESAVVRLSLIDMLGRAIRVLAEGEYAGGYHSIPLQAGDLASGTYLIRLEANGMQKLQKIVLVK